MFLLLCSISKSIGRLEHRCLVEEVTSIICCVKENVHALESVVMVMDLYAVHFQSQVPLWQQSGLRIFYVMESVSP